MLRTFGFIVHCDPPHKLLISMVKVCKSLHSLYVSVSARLNVCFLAVGLLSCA